MGASQPAKGRGGVLGKWGTRMLVILFLPLVHTSLQQYPEQKFSIDEELEPKAFVGTIGSTLQGVSPPYTFLDDLEVGENFTLEAQTGKLWTNRTLDRETKDLYSFYVESSSNYIMVEVKINDINDNSPNFSNDTQTLSISENAQVGAKYPLGAVTDKDLGVNGIRDCRIISGNDGNHFQLETRKRGSLKWLLDLNIAKSLDYELKSKYDVIIQATDGGNPRRTGELHLEILIGDQNDNQPRFTFSRYTAQIPENATVGTSVLQVSATDEDSGENGRVSYYLDPKDEKAKYFRVDPVSGIVRVNKPLDFETIPRFVLTINARDNGANALDASAALEIDLKNINELPANISLAFLQSDGNKTGRISEDVLEGTLVARISISDPDSPKEYFDANVTLLGGEGVFGLQKSHGIVYLVVISKPPDREIRPFYNLTIIATDSGDPPLHASYSFTILIDDVNDNDPQFTQITYTAEIHEVAEPGTSVVKVSAVDPDDGINAQIIYSISDQTPSTWFQIGTTTGLITTKSAIDCEMEPQPRLIIIASDGGKPPRIASATVIINVRDVNDKQPEFDQSFYSASVPENKAVGECILQVSAVDPECGQNAPVTYSMDGVGPAEFSVQSTTGWLCVARSLDFEQNPTYNFMIKASDREGLSGNTLVRVTVVDVNDNRPVFDPATYSISIKEGLSKQPLLTVHAQDDDEGTYGTVTYSILSGNTQFFDIDPSNGVISLLKKLPNGQRTYHMQVQATDGGGLQSSSPAQITVSVTGANAYPPSFSYLLYNYSISEGARKGDEVGTVVATTDDPQSSRVKYKILSGANSWFAIGELSGTITVVGDLDRERRTSMLLSVQAESGNPPTFATAQVNITILDMNDNAPAFAVPNNFLEINEREDRDTTSVIYIVQATDGDNERNGTIQYQLSNNAGNMFRIDPMSGEIRLSYDKHLDYETEKRYEMEVVAADRGTPVARSSSMTLVINVKDINDNPPIFARNVYNFSVQENIELTTSFAQINATDRDSDENGRVFYIFMDSPFTSVFGINPPNGDLYVKKTIDREDRDLYVLTVIASDHGKPSRLTSTAQIRIHVTDENDNDPKFSRELYHFSIQENLPIGSTVGHVRANDADIGDNAKLKYQFKNRHENFVINPNNGEITTMKRLDREENSQEKLTVIVSDKGSPQRSATATVRVDVLDVNDNTPQFEAGVPYTATVQENKPKETKVLQVMATDRDAKENGTVSYSLVNAPGDSGGTTNFAIHPSSGWISTKEVLDFETKKRYLLDVVARDNGSPSLEMRQPVTIEVGDDNDEAPLFHAKNVTFNVVENAPIGTSVGQVKAHDKDSGENGRVSYYIISGNVFSLFTVDISSGNITSIREIDYEESSSHTLGIRAVDNNVLYPKSSNISVTIRVIDINDNSPVFEQDPLLFSVDENTATGRSVHTYSATDKDSGHNGTVEYTIASESHSGPNPEKVKHFSIDPSSGQLKIRNNIDYEKVHQISLIVQASDKCHVRSCVLISSVTTIVYVNDVNDNYPVFESPTQIQIFEDEAVDYPVLYILATDIDSNENYSGNNLVTYKLLGGNSAGKFDLNTNTGLLTISNPLDREVKSSYALNISAEDQGTPKRISHQVLNIQIQDVNDNAPHFSNSTYHASVPEHGSSDSVVVTVRATDADVGSNANLTYMIPAGIANDKFSIDPITGIVKATTMLDREEKDTYIVSVYVRDGGYPTKYDQATIMVDVLDINDNSPIFKSQINRLHIPENSEQSAVFTFTAYDADAGSNAQITYSITDGNEENKFTIDPITGDLNCKTLDRETTEEYNLTITATDRGQQPRSGESLAFITVLDENDNDPRFSESVYRTRFPEDIRKGEIILQVMATDADKGHNGEVTYSLGNDTEGLFSVNATSGEIITTGLFDREKKAHYYFDIIALDGGVSGPRNSSAKIEITIDDINDNAPVFVRVPYRASVAQTAGSGTTVKTVEAYDPDAGLNGEVEYRMDSSHTWFEMRGDAIVTKRNLNAGAVGYHNIPIIVLDKGSPILSSTGVVEITVGSPPSHALSFTQEEYHKTIGEEKANGSAVIQVSVTPGTPGVTYRFAGGNEGNPFYVDPNNGMISVHNTDLIDYEASHQLRLIVQASAGGNQAYTTVLVNLTDYNDNPPKFTQNKYYTSVWENNAPETFVTQVQANDADSGRNGHVIYNIVSVKDAPEFSVPVFAINPPYTGIVTTNKDSSALDREVKSSYELLIEAVDNGIPRLSSTCVLSITINDENDNEPYFPKYPSIRISESRKVGSHVTTVTATDVDYNPKLVYSFTDNGNVDGSFSIDRFSGTISLAKPVDHEVKDHYVLGIAVSDGKHNAFTQIDIYIDDENDNAPEFSQQNYQVALEELTPPGSSVITVNATDADSGMNKQITYSLRPGFNNSFYIIPGNGTIFTSKNLTYEAFSSIIELVVIATDGGSPKLSDMVAVHVQITDINKYSPKFEKSKYIVNISEFSVRGESILHVRATDDDVTHVHRDDNINYKLFGEGATTFQIRRKTGEIFLMSQVNRENISQYNLTAIAIDRGIPPRSSTVPVTIIVEDENDNPPRFHQPDNIFHVQLPEDYPQEHEFQSVVADDADEGLNAEIQYTITSGNTEGIFHIHSTNGSLFIMPGAGLDYESSTFHRLIVRAVDCTNCSPAQPRWSAFVTIEINVTDVNEDSPKFPISPYVECVKENQPNGSAVFQAQANDADGGIYGVLSYSIPPNGTHASLFDIDAKTGQVITKAVFDYEIMNMYTFQIIVEDITKINKSIVDVTVKILDVDEYVPKFGNDSYTFKVLGSSRRGQHVGRVHATDRDGGTAGNVVYMIEFSSDYFDINPSTGNISVKRPFHEDAQGSRRKKRALEGESTTLIIKAWSGRDDSLEATAQIQVIIDRDCEGCVYTPQHRESYTHIALPIGIVLSILFIIAMLVVIVCLLRRRHRKKRPPHYPNDNGDSSGFGFTPPPAIRPPINGGPPPYKDHNLHFGADASNVTSSDISDHSHSASSGRGSAEEEEDEEIRMINSNSQLNSSQTYNRRKQMPDSGIQQDDDTLSEPSVQTHQEYLARLGIDSTKIGKPKPKATQIAHSVESMHQFSDEGGGEGNVDMGHSDYDKMTDMETDEEVAMIDRNKDLGFHEPETQHAGSLSSVINSEEEYSGSYNWDYLLNWGPQYQPLAHVFAEIAKLKDDSAQPRKPPVRTVPQRQLNTGLPPPKVKTVPPPMITNAPPKAFAPRPSHSSSGSSSHPNSARASTMNISLPSLPRSPISYDSTITSPAMTPSFTPSLSPLATGSPSPVVSAHGSGHSSGHNTPGKRVPKQNGRLALSASSESEQEFRI